jgi:hypothetical protein
MADARLHITFRGSSNLAVTVEKNLGLVHKWHVRSIFRDLLGDARECVYNIQCDLARLEEGVMWRQKHPDTSPF